MSGRQHRAAKIGVAAADDGAILSGWSRSNGSIPTTRQRAMAGHTVVIVDDERPAYAAQEDTAVAREHRGHRLGMLLKADMCRWLRESEPAVEFVDTWNAASNHHMVGVNERLGYEVIGHGREYQRRI
jgi:GNAT superfamily N-acetyltransferase